MYPLLETIRFEAGQFHNLEYHQQRVNRAFEEFWPQAPVISLKAHLQKPNQLNIIQRYKYRVVYDTQIQQITFEPYKIRPIYSLKLLEAPQLQYYHKKHDRSELTTLFDQRGTHDDILITQNGYLTDTYYCNIACWSGQKWLTPAQPLLEGTQRSKLINEGMIFPATIHQSDLPSFQKIMLFNAMISPEDALVVSSNQIFID